MTVPGGWTSSTAHSFAFHTPAAPAVVWDALTVGTACGGCFAGLSVQSDWRTGSPLLVRTAGSDSDGAIGGAVLHAAPPTRLSYYFQAEPGDPCTYLTWQVRPTTRGCVVKLQVDEFECPDDEVAAEDAWLPVLAVLQATLAPR